MAVASLVLGVVGAGISAMGAIEQGQAQANMYNYQAQVARANADYAIKAGTVQAQNAGMRDRAQMGKIIAAQAASGVDIGSGTPKQVQASESELANYDQNQTMTNAQMKAVGLENQAGLDSLAADNAETAGSINAFSSIAGGATSFASKWSQFGAMGII